VYIFGSQDIYGEKHLCGGDYVCWSSAVEDLSDTTPEKMLEWKNEGVIYSRMQDPFIKKIVQNKKGNLFNQYLYAPDVIEIEEKYYLYYGVGLSGSGIGVAVAHKPTGPYTYIGRVRYPEDAKPSGWQDTSDGIDDGDMALGLGVPMLQPNPFKKHFGIHFRDYVYDPAVLYENGRLYLYFGSGYCYVSELSTDDKLTLKKNPESGRYYSERLLPSSSEKGDKSVIAKQDGWHMANGASIRKIGDIYYLCYYAIKKYNNHALCYSTAPTPFGPFVYGGVLVSLGRENAEQVHPTAYGGNTHGGIFTVGERWFVNYHRQTGDHFPARQACMSELTRTADGRFLQSPFATQVEKSGGILSGSILPAYAACVLTDRSEITRKRTKSPYLTVRKLKSTVSSATGEEVSQVVTGLSDGCIVGFRYFDFGTTETTRQISILLNDAKEGRIDVIIDDNTPKNKICTIPLRENRMGSKWEVGATIPVCGIHSLLFCFYGQGKTTDFISFMVK
jgi:hypothetical protein